MIRIIHVVDMTGKRVRADITEHGEVGNVPVLNGLIAVKYKNNEDQTTKWYGNRESNAYWFDPWLTRGAEVTATNTNNIFLSKRGKGNEQIKHSFRVILTDQ